MEQSGGRSRVLCWELVGLVCFAGGDTSKQGKPGKPMKPKENKEKQGEPLQSTKEILSNQWDSFLNGGNTLPLSGNAKRLRAMVGGVLLVVDIVCWCGSDAEGTKGNGRRRWRGVGPAGRPFPVLLWR